MTKKTKTSDALAIIRRRHYEGRPERHASLEEERQNAAIARTLYALRTRVGLTQLQLAQRVGTTASVISRLENADYEGHSLSMLRRVANALGKDIDLRFVARRAAGMPQG